MGMLLLTGLSASDKIINAVKTNTTINVDGIVNNTEWTSSDSGSGFIQMEPDKGSAASEKTVVLVAFDETHLYIAFKCYVNSVETIVSNIQVRDNISKSDDAVGLIIDSYLDRRSGYVFLINPLGTLTDIRIGDDGRSEDINWDTQWQAASKIHRWGWSVEMAIPFSSISYDENLTDCGINFVRTIRANAETSYWSGIMNSDFRISQSGLLRGISLPPKRKTLRFTPYSTIRVEKNNIPIQEQQTDLEFGADLAYHITSSLIMNLTYNPDFATVEGDQERINLTRWELSFPEKRLFFLEGNELFEFKLI